MARELDQDELIERWTLIGDVLERVANKRSAAKLGFALLQKSSPRMDGSPADAVSCRLRRWSAWPGNCGFWFGGVGAPGR